MRPKRLMVIALILCIVGGFAVAATPSVFDLGLVNYYTVDDLMETDFAAYTPGLRASFYVNSWFGLSGDVFLTAPFAEGGLEAMNFLLSTDLVFRAPLGFFEPYLAIGPSYQLTLGEGALSLAEAVLYSARVGFDFNITPVFALGVEGMHLINVGALIADSSTFVDDVLANTSVGLVLKAKF